MLRNQIILLSLVLVAGCGKENLHSTKTNSFEIYIDGMEPITFYNPECQFNNFYNQQSQFNSQSGNGYALLSSYWNYYSPDSVLNQVWINLKLTPTPPNISHNLDSLAKYLATVDTSLNDQNLRMDFLIEIDGIQYYNTRRDSNPNIPIRQKNDSLAYVIQDFEIFYHSECMERDLLYVKIEIEGKLYSYDFLINMDSIKINKSKMELLFSADLIGKTREHPLTQVIGNGG